MRRPTTMTTAFAALGGVALLLAGCSGGSDASTDDTNSNDASGSVFEFQTNGVEPSDKVTIRVPDDLRDAMGAEANGLVVDQLVATPHKVEGVENCAVDLQIGYADGQPDALISAGSQEGVKSQRETDLVEAFDASSLDDVIDELDEIIDSRTDQGYSSSQVTQSLRDQVKHPIALEYRDGDSGESLVKRYLDQPGGAGASDVNSVALALGRGASPGAAEMYHDVYPASDLDDSAPEPGTYVSPDYSTMTVVDDCAASATDPDNAVELELTKADEDGKLDTLAKLQLSTMTDGTIGVGGEVEDYTRDANDNWIAK